MSNLSNIMNKEKIVFVLALILFAWGLHGILSQENKRLLLPRGKKLDRETHAFLVPDIRLKESDRLYVNGGKEVFAEPVDMKPLEPLELEKLPARLEEAATGAIDVDGYRQPAVAVDQKPARQLTPEQREAARERLARAREARRAKQAV